MHRPTAVYLVLLFVLQGLALFAPAGADEEAMRTAEITASSLNIRSGPSTGAEVLRAVGRGSIVVLLEERDGWSRVRLEDGTIGWGASNYMRLLDTPSRPTTPGAASPTPTPSPREAGRGLELRPILKWGSLGAAVLCGALAYSKRSSGNDSYDEYKELFNDGDYDAADVKFEETEDFDSSAQLYAIVGSAFLGVFIWQQFFAGDEAPADQAARPAQHEPSLTFDPRTGTARLQLVRLAF